MAELDMTRAGFNLGAFNQMPFNLVGGGPEDVTFAFDAAMSLDGTAGLYENTEMPRMEYAAIRLEANATPASNTVMPGMLGAIALHGKVINARFVVDEIRIDTVLNPGQTVVIDARDFTVKVDGADAMDAHQGAWPIIDDNTYDIAFGSASGAAGVEARAEWVERYL